MLRQEEADLPAFLRRVVVGGRVLDAQVRGPDALLDAAHDAEMRMARQRRRQDADDAVVVAGERPCREVGHISHLLHLGDDPLAKVVRHLVRLPQGPRDGDRTDAERLGDIL